MRCSTCSAEMGESPRGAAKVQLCPSCGSCWTDRGSMQAFIEGIERSFTAASLAALRAECAQRRQAALTDQAPSGMAYRKCPECGVQMHRKAFAPWSGIVADVCAGHGFLLVLGQLEAIAGFVARGGEILALEAINQELVDHLADLKRKVTDVEQARSRAAGGAEMIFFIG